MVKRIETIRASRREYEDIRARLLIGLKKHTIKVRDVVSLYHLYDALYVWHIGNRGLFRRVRAFKRDIERWGDEWAQDDWPHACQRERPRAGRFFGEHGRKDKCQESRFTFC